MKSPEEKDEMAALEEQLTPFLRNNPYSEIKKRGKLYYVINPWKDESIYFVLRPESQSDLIAALNNLILPRRFTALYHLDTNTVEYIYTLLDENSPYLSRQFEFTTDGKVYYCRFEDASERLLLLSKLFRPTGKEAAAEYRNLMLLHLYMNPKLIQSLQLEQDFFTQRKPVSFSVSGFEKFDEDKIVEISKHLNFFMLYYDRESPSILIHSVERELAEPAKQLQFVETTFPEKISTRRQDPFLLDLALTARTVETRLQFLYYYQILEYAAFYYTDDEVRRDLLNIINTPDIHSNPERHISRILDTVSGVRQEEEAKIQKVVKMVCRPEVVWKELQQDVSYFSQTQQFDGGFVLEAFIDETTTVESFCAMWHPKTADTLRFIRNALVHGRERKFGKVISPTPRNDQLIKPWVATARRIAEEVIIFGRVT